MSAKVLLHGKGAGDQSDVADRTGVSVKAPGATILEANGATPTQRRITAALGR